MSPSGFTLRPLGPFRLDLTAWALKRRPGNLIDRWDGSTYRRVVAVSGKPHEVAVVQSPKASRQLHVHVSGGPLDHRTKLLIRRTVHRLLGTPTDLAGFYRLAARDRKLAPLVERFQGLKPPRFPTPFEALINGIACQQISLAAGIQIMNRLARQFSLSTGKGDSRSYAFPRPEDLAAAPPEELRKLGFTGQKARAIVEASQALAEGRLDFTRLARMSDEDVLQRLMELRGVGQWTAEYTLLRGMGRWRIFPAGDIGARNALGRWLRLPSPLDAERTHQILEPWKPYAGMLYFLMLMNGLDEAGLLGSSP